MEITILEDDEAYWQDWDLIGMKLGVHINKFCDLDDFQENMDVSKICNQVGIFVDYDLGEYDAMTVNVADVIRKSYNYQGPIYLMSLLDEFQPDHEKEYKNYYRDRLDKKEDLKLERVERISSLLGIS